MVGRGGRSSPFERGRVLLARISEVFGFFYTPSLRARYARNLHLVLDVRHRRRQAQSRGFSVNSPTGSHRSSEVGGVRCVLGLRESGTRVRASANCGADKYQPAEKTCLLGKKQLGSAQESGTLASSPSLGSSKQCNEARAMQTVLAKRVENTGSSHSSSYGPE